MYMCGRHCPRCSASVVWPSQLMMIRRVDSSTHRDIIGHKNSNNDIFSSFTNYTCCIVCQLIVVCFVAGSGALWRPYDDGGRHDRMMQRFTSSRNHLLLLLCHLLCQHHHHTSCVHDVFSRRTGSMIDPADGLRSQWLRCRRWCSSSPHQISSPIFWLGLIRHIPT
jgi:hypothetical protein